MPATLTQRYADRLMSKVVWNGDQDECWEWQAAKTASGYGKFSISNGEWKLAHRASYEFHVGEIPPGLEIDHLCRNRACVNPDHLEPVTHAENQRRNAHSTKTHCKHGHPFDKANTIRRATGARACRACIRRRQASK